MVTAFTLAHSITLSIAALGLVSLPARLVESVIAASVVMAALNNLYPLVTRRLWMVAFGFGLVHGFGFASVLAGLGLPQDALLLALLGFNLGVEAGQLAIALAIMPIAFWLRQSWLYERVALQLGSLVIGALASLWLSSAPSASRSWSPTPQNSAARSIIGWITSSGQRRRSVSAKRTWTRTRPGNSSCSAGHSGHQSGASRLSSAPK